MECLIHSLKPWPRMAVKAAPSDSASALAWAAHSSRGGRPGQSAAKLTRAAHCAPSGRPTAEGGLGAPLPVRAPPLCEPLLLQSPSALSSRQSAMPP
eukprot:1033489-Pyramimonas_sp.AAC.1